MSRDDEVFYILKTQILDAGIEDRSEALASVCNYLCKTYPGKKLEPNLERLGLQTTKEVRQEINKFFVKKNYL